MKLVLNVNALNWRRILKQQNEMILGGKLFKAESSQQKMKSSQLSRRKRFTLHSSLPNLFHLLDPRTRTFLYENKWFVKDMMSGWSARDILTAFSLFFCVTPRLLFISLFRHTKFNENKTCCASKQMIYSLSKSSEANILTRRTTIRDGSTPLNCKRLQTVTVGKINSFNNIECEDLQ